jgi:sec-independent protein translocase protein TatC
MTLIEHLDELRSRIIKIGIAFFAMSIVAWFFHEEIFEALMRPAPSLGGQLSFTGLTAPLITDIKLSLYAAFLVTIPFLLYQAWAFVAPAVGNMGRAFTYTLIAMASSLFLAGVAFGYFVVLPIGIDFLLGWDPERYEEIITADTYLAFVTRFLLAFGIVFEFPAATYVGAKLELVDAPLLKKYRKHAIVINTVLAAALTPGQDPFSMVLMAIPMVVMYEVSIVIARYVNPVSDATSPARTREEGDEDGPDEPESEETPERNGSGNQRDEDEERDL